MSHLPEDTTRAAQAEQQMSDEDARGRRETRALPEEDWARSEVAEQEQEELAEELRGDQKPETD